MTYRIAALLTVLILGPHAILAQELVEDLVLGLGDFHETEDFYRSIGAVTTDSNGRIFVSEYHGGDIRVYEEDGTYIRTLGSRGEAPGEFRTITALGVAPDGRLTVLDQVNHRSSWYEPNLDSVSVARLPGNRQIGTPQLLWLNEDEVLAHSWSCRMGSTESELAGCGLMQVYDADLAKEVASIGQPADFQPDDEMGATRLVASLSYLQLLVLSSDSVLVSEEYHPGYLTLFVRSSEGWKKGGIWRGAPVVRRYRLLDSPAPGTPMEDLPYQAIRSGWSGPAGPWFVDIWSWSRGLAWGPGGTVLHFAYVYDGKRGTFGVEEFSQAGVLKAYHRLQVSRRGQYAVDMAGAEIMHQDAEGRLYLRHGQDGAPVVRRMRFVR